MDLETIPALRTFSSPMAEYNYTSGKVKEGRVLYLLYHSNPHVAILVADVLCFCLMTFDLFIRYLVSKSTLKFCTNFLNIIDLLALLPMWICMILFGFRQASPESNDTVTTALQIVSILRLLRILRAVRVMKNFKPTKMLFMALKASSKVLLLLLSLMVICAVVFATLLFFAEMGEDTVPSILDAIWWAFVTMTTVGYGDITPLTLPGRLVGIVCAISGLVLVAMLVPVIVSNFTDRYDKAVIISQHTPDDMGVRPNFSQLKKSALKRKKKVRRKSLSKQKKSHKLQRLCLNHT